MGKILRAECRSILKNKAIIILMVIYSMLFFLLFYNKAVNTESMFYQKEIVTPFYMMAFVGVCISVTCDIPASILLGSLGGDCFGENSCSRSVLICGRVRFWGLKILSAALLSLFFSSFTILLGLILGLFVNQSWQDFSAIRTVEILLVTTLYVFQDGMRAFLIAFLLKNSRKGIIANIAITYGFNIFSGGVSDFFNHYLLGWNLNAIQAKVFSIITERHDAQIAFTISAPESVLPELAISACLIAVTIFVICYTSSKREYTV